MKSIWQIVKTEIKRMYKKPMFYIAITFVVACCLITFSRNYSMKNLCALHQTGAINTFIYSAIVDNTFLYILAPALSGITCISHIVDDLNSTYNRQISIRSSNKHYLTAKVISAFISGASVLGITFLVVFLFCFIADPRPSIPLDFISTSTYGTVYDRSMFAYCVVYIVHSIVWGAAYAVFDFKIALISRNKYIAIDFTTFSGYFFTFLYVVIPQYKKELAYFIPAESLNILSVQTPIQFATQALVTFTISVLVCSIWYYIAELNGDF